MANCSLVYLDIGSNVGDSIQSFASRRPEARLAATLQAAGHSQYKPKTTCLYGFEPAPQHTARLTALRERLAPAFANITIYTETALGGPEQVAAPMWLAVAGGRSGVGSHLVSQRPKSGKATPVRTWRLAAWLRDFIAPAHGPDTPIVMRMDARAAMWREWACCSRWGWPSAPERG